jgi:hypothetical protein
VELGVLQGWPSMCARAPEMPQHRCGRDQVCDDVAVEQVLAGRWAHHGARGGQHGDVWCVAWPVIRLVWVRAPARCLAVWLLAAFVECLVVVCCGGGSESLLDAGACELVPVVVGCSSGGRRPV